MTNEEETTLLKAEVSRLQTDLSKSKIRFQLFAGITAIIAVFAVIHVLADTSASHHVNRLDALLAKTLESPVEPRQDCHQYQFENYKLIQRLEKSDIAKRMCWAQLQEKEDGK